MFFFVDFEISWDAKNEHVNFGVVIGILGGTECENIDLQVEICRTTKSQPERPQLRCESGTKTLRNK